MSTYVNYNETSIANLEVAQDMGKNDYFLIQPQDFNNKAKILPLRSLYSCIKKFEENASYTCNTVKDAKSINFKINDTFNTVGFYDVNDGGGASYIVISDNSLKANNYNIIQLNNGLKAKLIIYDNVINLKQWGAKADYKNRTSFTSNDKVFKCVEEYLLNYISTDEFIYYVPEGKYGITDTINVPRNCNVEIQGNIYYIDNDNTLDRPALRLHTFNKKTIHINTVTASSRGGTTANTVHVAAGDEFAGIEFASMYNCNIHIVNVVNFAVGVHCIGGCEEGKKIRANGFAWNHFYIHRIDACRIGIYCHIAKNEYASYINGNTFSGGYIGSIYCKHAPINNNKLLIHAIKLEDSNDNTFRDFDITGYTSTASTNISQHVYNKGRATVFDNLRWECGPDNEYNRMCVVDVDSISAYTNNVTWNYSKSVYFSNPRYIQSGAGIDSFNRNVIVTYKNAYAAFFGLDHICKQDNVQPFITYVQFNTYNDTLPISYNASNYRYTTSYRGCMSTSSGLYYGVGEIDRDYDVIYSKSLIMSTMIDNSTHKLATPYLNAPSFVFKINDENATFRIQTDGRAGTYIRCYDQNWQELHGNNNLTCTVSLNGNDKYGTFKGWWYEDGKGEGIITPLNGVPFNVTCVPTATGYITDYNHTLRKWEGNNMTGVFLYNTPDDMKCIGRRISAQFHDRDTALTTSYREKFNSFTVFDSAVKYIIISFYNYGVADLTDAAMNFTILGDGKAEYIQYTDKYRHLQGTNNFYSTVKPTFTPNGEIDIPDGQKVYSANKSDWGKYWQFNKSTNSWSDLTI